MGNRGKASPSVFISEFDRMENTIKKSDFVLTPYMQSSDWRGAVQVLNTIGPYVLLWWLAVQVMSISVWLLPPVVGLLTLFSIRCFSLMHDCGHHSLFKSEWLNRAAGFLFGVINAIPQYPWSRGHAYHHKTNGDWQRYRGPSGLASTEEFTAFTPAQQRNYAILRHPLMIFPGGFFYLAIKPRMALILGSIHFLQYAFTSLKQDPGQNLKQMVLSYKAKHWYTGGEFWHLLFNNICVVGGSLWIGAAIGYALFFGIYAFVLTMSAAVFICVFFVQHNFEGSYAHKTEGWDYLLGALEGSSYLKFPIGLKWFSADIGYHSIHHLSSRIPNYNLEACHQANSHLLTNVTTLHFSDIPDCFKFILWDAATDRLVSIDEYHSQIAVPTESLA
jgi:acyl-lipid omega-6 desaturase (Delta-12 desaturase)